VISSHALKACGSDVSAALSLFLGGIEWCAGDRIVTLRDEFPNQYYCAASLADRGVELIRMNEIPALPERTRAVLVSTVNYSSGYRPDMEFISSLARRTGALLFVDGTQSVGAMRFDTAAVKPDMLAVDGYKWLLCPNGAAFFYISPELRRTLKPSVTGWRSDQGWRSVNELHHGDQRLQDAAEKYGGGMLNFPSICGAGESVRMMLEIGPECVERRVLELAGMTAEILRHSGATVLYNNTNIVAAHWPYRDAAELARKLQAQRILVAARHGNLRIWPHFYNSEADLELLRAALAP
jgi:cysteine desulfurase / selenocysteine lyase